MKKKILPSLKGDGKRVQYNVLEKDLKDLASIPQSLPSTELVIYSCPGLSWNKLIVMRDM